MTKGKFSGSSPATDGSVEIFSVLDAATNAGVISTRIELGQLEDVLQHARRHAGKTCAEPYHQLLRSHNLRSDRINNGRPLINSFCHSCGESLR